MAPIWSKEPEMDLQEQVEVVGSVGFLQVLMEMEEP